MSSQLLILGASARAAATSAIGAGLRPIAVDRFADLDLAAIAPARRVDDFPNGLEAACAELPPCPWIYTGGLENHPDLVDRIAAGRTLYGNPATVLRRVRDPFRLAQVLREEGFACPDVATQVPSRRAGPWLRKPRASCGGWGIVRVDAENGGARSASAGVAASYFQRFVSGDAASALYVAAAGRAVLVGLARQLIGCAWAGARGFQYAGSLGPLRPSPEVAATFRRLGERLAVRFGLVGLFGVDAVIANETVWPLEVNPRYTASAEILERACGIATLAMHVLACREGRVPSGHVPEGRECWGKAVLYAEQDMTVTSRLMPFARRSHGLAACPLVADIPPAGRRIPAGDPIVSVFACGRTLRSAADELRRRADETRQALRT